MNEYINVLVKHPGHPAHFCRAKNTLKSLQGLVGGYIETVTLATDLVLICNFVGADLSAGSGKAPGQDPGLVPGAVF